MRLCNLRFGARVAASLLNMKNLTVAKLREAVTLGQFWSFNLERQKLYYPEQNDRKTSSSNNL